MIFLDMNPDQTCQGMFSQRTSNDTTSIKVSNIFKLNTNNSDDIII